MRIRREDWLRLGTRRHFVLPMAALVILGVAAIITFPFDSFDQQKSRPRADYDKISERLEAEEGTLARMQESRLTSFIPDVQARDAEQKQADLIFRLMKERDAAKEALK